MLRGAVGTPARAVGGVEDLTAGGQVLEEEAKPLVAPPRKAQGGAGAVRAHSMCRLIWTV